MCAIHPFPPSLIPSNLSYATVILLYAISPYHHIVEFVIYDHNFVICDQIKNSPTLF